MLRLDAYSGKNIQNALNILNQLVSFKKGITVEEGLILLQKDWDETIKNTEQKNRRSKPIKRMICPSCNQWYLLPTLNYEGLNIMSCKKCRYSTIVEEEIENG